MGVVQVAQEPLKSMSVRDNSTNDGIEPQASTPSLIPPSYSLKPLSTKDNVRAFAGIIFGNCLVSGCICLTLWGFARHTNLVIWEKRAFNTLSLLFSGALGFGIGFLCDRIGLLARGKFLESAANSIEDVSSSGIFFRRHYKTHTSNPLFMTNYLPSPTQCYRLGPLSKGVSHNMLSSLHIESAMRSRLKSPEAIRMELSFGDSFHSWSCQSLVALALYYLDSDLTLRRMQL